MKGPQRKRMVMPAPAPVGRDVYTDDGWDEGAYGEEELGADFYDDDALDRAPPREYTESRYGQCCLRCCGGACWVLLGLCIVAWVAHSIPVGGVADAPAFSKTLLWMSIAHHTDTWQTWQASTPPPPPNWAQVPADS